jgi:aryl sulfotransferase
VDLLIFQSVEARPIPQISPWLDSILFHPVEQDLATLKAQTHRRSIKSHLPFDALPVWDTVKYIHVGRDGRDARLSWHNHERGYTREFSAQIAARAKAAALEAGESLNGPPPPIPDDPREYLLNWFAELENHLDASGRTGAARFGAFFDFETSYWAERQRSNLLFVHYNDLKEDLAGEMQRIADFLEIETLPERMPALVEAASFEAMKKNGESLFSGLTQIFDRGADRFINQGKSGRWRQYLNAEDTARYQRIVARACSPGLARWLEEGRRGAGDPKLLQD